tara:strand:+ start:78 stop:464 length:387 start_codon:yes stop_codon:yes gene_type:complete
MKLIPLLIILAVCSSASLAGTGYEVTSKDGDRTVTYMVRFGGGKLFEQYTAYDPDSKSFVYLTWPRRGGKPPVPAARIWDHESGRTIELFKFPKVKHPLPVIPDIKAMKVCPKTGDKDFKAVRRLAYD